MQLGEAYAAFWPLSLREIALISAAIQKRQADRVDRDRVLNQELAQLIAFAFHDPKKIPDLTRARAAPEVEEITGEDEADARMRAGLFALKAFYDQAR